MHTPELTIADRCDRCGAQAYTEWQGPHPDLGTFSLPLTLCAHHDHELTPRLEAKQWGRVVDERWRLTYAVREPEPA